MNYNQLQQTLERWDFPIGPFQTLKSIEKEMQALAASLDEIEILELLDQLVSICAEDKEKVDIGVELMHEVYKHKLVEVANAIQLRSEVYKEDHFFITMLSCIPEGNQVVEAIVLKEIPTKSKAWKMDYLGMIARLARKEDGNLIQQFLINETDPEVIEEVQIVLQQCKCF